MARTLLVGGCTCGHINKSAYAAKEPPKNRSIMAALPNRVVGDELGVYESNKQQVRENEIDMLTIYERHRSKRVGRGTYNILRGTI